MKIKPFIKLRQNKEAGEPDWLKLFQKAVQLHQKGVDGDTGAVREALGLLEQVRRKVPDHNLVRAYYGSTLCLLGRDLEDNLQRCAQVVQGLKHLDQAVQNEPGQIEIRLLRGLTCVNLPETYFHQNAKAVADFEYLITCYERYPKDIPKDLYFQSLSNLCIAYRNLGQSEAVAVIQRKLRQEFNPGQLQQSDSGDTQANLPLYLQPLSRLLEAAKKMHQQALSGDKQGIQQALVFFDKARLLYPEQPLFEVYYADCLSLQGSLASNPGEMFAKAIKATKIMDAAVVNHPDDLRIRLVRAHHSMRLPELFFARTVTAVIDWEYLIERWRQNPQLFTAEEIEEIRYRLGLCYQRLGLAHEAEELWQELLPEATPAMRRRIAAVQGSRNDLGPLPTVTLEGDCQGFYREAKRLHNLGVAGNPVAARLALQLWEQAQAFNPADPVARGYYGSALALTGRDSNQVNEMFANAIKGLKLLNEALDSDPGNWELRLLRGYLSYSLPEVFFHTGQRAIADFQFLIRAYKQNPALFPQELYEQICADLEQACQRSGKCQAEEGSNDY
ncbi:MAG TPA: hypothetical protein VIM29_03475 [Bacillota bacterium]